MSDRAIRSLSGGKVLVEPDAGRCGGDWFPACLPARDGDAAYASSNFSPRRRTVQRLGAVPYLNALPLTEALGPELLRLPPSNLAEALQAGHLDAALISFSEVLFSDRYVVLDGVGIISSGPVLSVYLAHRGPLDEIQRVYVDPVSRCSVWLLKVLMRERGFIPEFLPMPDDCPPERFDAVLLIGDAALRYRSRARGHVFWDLGEAWRENIGLPFVYAVWAIHREAAHPALLTRLGMAARDGLIDPSRTLRGHPKFDTAFYRAYLERHIRYQLGPAEKLGGARFAALLQRHFACPVRIPTYVNAPPEYSI